MTAFELYRPVEDDWEAIRDIGCVPWRTSRPPSSSDSRRSRSSTRWSGGRAARRNHAPGSRQLIARVPDGRWVASMTIFTSEGPPAYLGDSEGGEPRANLVGVWVDPEYPRSRMPGSPTRCCSRSASGCATSCGLDRLYLHVGDWNVRARRFYERHGFHATGVTEKLPGDLSDFEYELVLDLTAGG